MSECFACGYSTLVSKGPSCHAGANSQKRAGAEENPILGLVQNQGNSGDRVWGGSQNNQAGASSIRYETSSDVPTSRS